MLKLILYDCHPAIAIAIAFPIDTNFVVAYLDHIEGTAIAIPSLFASFVEGIPIEDIVVGSPIEDIVVDSLLDFRCSF